MGSSPSALLDPTDDQMICPECSPLKGCGDALVASSDSCCSRCGLGDLSRAIGLVAAQLLSGAPPRHQQFTSLYRVVAAEAVWGTQGLRQWLLFQLDLEPRPFIAPYILPP